MRKIKGRLEIEEDDGEGKEERIEKQVFC